MAFGYFAKKKYYLNKNPFCKWIILLIRFYLSVIYSNHFNDHHWKRCKITLTIYKIVIFLLLYSLFEICLKNKTKSLKLISWIEEMNRNELKIN